MEKKEGKGVPKTYIIYKVRARVRGHFGSEFFLFFFIFFVGVKMEKFFILCIRKRETPIKTLPQDKREPNTPPQAQ